jgi:uncharacterized protein YndB with AHSA1/START domain
MERLWNMLPDDLISVEPTVSPQRVFRALTKKDMGVALFRR